jgi:hypothetical protein
MNCLDFRRACLVDPAQHEPAFREHAERCPACGEFLHAQRRAEEQLRRALAVEPPETLAARILLRRSFAQRLRRPLAIAATVIVSLTAGSLMFLFTRPPALEAEVLAHILAEPEHLTAREPAAGKVAAVLQALGAQVDGLPAEVRYAGICDIRRRPGAHFVFQGERGPVTVLLMPEEAVARRLAIQGDGLEGTVLPAGSGSIAVIGNRGEPVEALAERLRIRIRG